MGRQIIKKDNNDIAIWSTIVDDFIFEGTLQEYKNLLIIEAMEKIDEKIEKLKNNIGFSNTTYKEACEERDHLRKLNS